jgi:AhpD family alkylhydroperoxidase
MGEMEKALNEVELVFKTMAKESPEAMAYLSNFAQAIQKEGALSKKVKELIALALGVAAHCKWCIAFHVKEALNEGATKEEIIEVINVATSMGGGPSLMYGQLALRALDEFLK